MKGSTKKKKTEEEEDIYKEPDEPLDDRKRSWLLSKSEIKPLVRRNRQKYVFHERAQQAYAQYLSGYSYDEISQFLEITPDDVRKDVQHIQTELPVKTIIAHNNDRNRILIQRTQADAYGALLGQSMEIKATEYLRAGISPVAPLKEYREAVGMTEKPGAFSLHLTQTSAQIQVSKGEGIHSPEDVLRHAMAKLDEPPAIDISAQETTIQQEQIEDPDIMEDAE